MLLCRHILLIYVFLKHLIGSDSVDVIGFQVVRFRDNDKLNMSVVLKNIPRGSKMAWLYFKKYSSTFTYKPVNVTGSEAVFDNVDFIPSQNVYGNEMHSMVILQNNIEYGNKKIMKWESITNSEEDNKKGVPHACFQSCRMIIDYQETPSMSTNITGIPGTKSAQHEVHSQAAPTNPGNPGTKSAQHERDAVSEVHSQAAPTNTAIPDTKSAQHEVHSQAASINAGNPGTKSAQHEVNSQAASINTGNPGTKSAQHERDAVSEVHSQAASINTGNPGTKSAQHERDAVSEVHSQAAPTNTGIPGTKSAQHERDAVSEVHFQAAPTNTGNPDTKSAQHERDAVSEVPSQSVPTNTESDWKSICLVITSIVIIILLIIIISKVIRTPRINSQGVLRSYSLSSHSVKFVDLAQKYDAELTINDETRSLQTFTKQWKNNEFYVNDNPCDTSNYYSYATK